MASTTVDWGLAASLGARIVPRGPRVAPETARGVVTDLRSLAAEAEGLVADVTGLPATPVPGEEVLVVDRPAWIAANVAGFSTVLEPAFTALAQSKGGGPPRVVNAVTSRLSGVEVGGALALVATRVLGQYEIFMPPGPDGSSGAGRLTLVAPNVLAAERTLGVDPHDFRLWVCAHEVAHRAQFRAAGWLRDYLTEGITEFLSVGDTDLLGLLRRLRDATGAVAGAATGAPDGLSLIDAMQTPEQRAVMARLSTAMAVLEGHGEYVMDHVTEDAIPTVREISRRFHHRRHAGGTVDRALRRLLGLEAKIAQYEDGERFVRGVVEAAGMPALNRVWAGPQWLPTAEELADPQAWVTRTSGPAAPDRVGAPTVGAGPSVTVDNGSDLGVDPAPNA